MLRTYLLSLLVCAIFYAEAKSSLEKITMDKICGSDPITLDGDDRPGVFVQLTSSSKYKSNLNCTIKFRTTQPSQRLTLTMEKMDLIDCPGDSLMIYDGTNLLNKEQKQQCGSPSSFFLTSTATQLTFTFTSNSATESSGFQIALALHFPAVASCPQNLGFFQCKNKLCISKQLQCNDHNHCGDGTDELQCSSLIG